MYNLQKPKDNDREPQHDRFRQVEFICRGFGSFATVMGGSVVDTYRIAGAVVRVESLHADVHTLCRRYRFEGEPDFTVLTSQADIDFERERSEAAETAEAAAERGERASSDGYLETLAVYRKIAEAMPARDAVLVHGSCVAVDGSAYLFCAPSGTGKSTHARRWRELLGERAMMVNDDKPLVRVTDGGAIAYGTPWDGKHRLSSDVAVPLRAVCLLTRGDGNHIGRLAAAEAYPALLRHVYRPLDPAALALTLALVDRMVARVDLWRLHCTKGIEAAEVSFSAMSGGEFL